MPVTTHPAVCIVGMGPRGTSIIERFAANAAAFGPDAPWDLHLVDDAPFGCGRIWRPDQTPELCMNTLAGAVTLFTDDSVEMEGDIVDGPTFYEWCMLVLNRVSPDASSRSAVANIAARRRRRFELGVLRPELTTGAVYLDEIRRTVPHSHPSRGLYGMYLMWCLDLALSALPTWVTVHEHHTRATGIQTADGRELVTLDDGTRIPADVVILATGWLEREPTASDAMLVEAAARPNGGASVGLVWVPPASPVEQDLSSVPAGEDVIVRGLGMGFFDTMSLLTIGRGGRFTEERGEGELIYLPSGEEPILHVTSGRGVPFRAKSCYGGLPPVARLPRLMRAARESGRVRWDFEADLWPLIVRDAHEQWFRTLEEVQPSALPAPLSRLLDTIDDPDFTSLDERLAALVPDPAHRFNLHAAMAPADRSFDSPAEFDAFVADYVRSDLREASQGSASPLKAALWVISAARKPVSDLLSFDGTTAESYLGPYRRFMAFGGMVGSGPPAFRSSQLLALYRAGLVHFIGPRPQLSFDADRVTLHARSPLVAGSGVESRVLVDAWMHAHDVAATRDQLVTSLLAAGHARPHARPTSGGGAAPGPALDIDPRTSALVRSDGTTHERVHLIGIPVEGVRGDTVISPMPNRNATFLRETDGVVVHVLRRLTRLATDEPAHKEPERV